MSGPHKSQRPVGTFTNSDTRGDGDVEIRTFAPPAYRKRSRIETSAVLLTRDGESLRQFSGPVCQPANRAVPFSTRAHLFQAAGRFECTDENTAGIAFAVGHYVQAFVHAIDEIHICSTRRAEQNFGAFGNPPRGVRSQVVETEIGLRLHDRSRGIAVQQYASEQRRCKLDCRAIEKREVELSGGSQQTRQRIRFVRGLQCTLEH